MATKFIMRIIDVPPTSFRLDVSLSKALVSCLERKFWLPKQSKTPIVVNIHQNIYGLIAQLVTCCIFIFGGTTWLRVQSCGMSKCYF
jgi:hypothetical protein